MNAKIAHENMIEQQIRPWEVLDSRVLEVMSQITRSAFVPEKYQQLAWADLEIPIGHGEKMMHPRVEGRIMQVLNIQPTDRVYEIGTGSGYLTACLSQLAAHVDSIEIHPDLSTTAGARLDANGFSNITLKVGDALSSPDKNAAKYDVIVLTGSIPDYKNQFESLLNPGGRMFVVTGNEPAMQAILLTKEKARDKTEGTSNSATNKQVVFETSLMPLTGAEKQPTFNL